mmetsp:Transcript_13917/g.20896  ORF Transcript_13917/g.20896 Transcript_13917/m.20896 type:complete len:100 (-) Transcript_13917:1202-1501(-)
MQYNIHNLYGACGSSSSIKLDKDEIAVSNALAANRLGQGYQQVSKIDPSQNIMSYQQQPGGLSTDNVHHKSKFIPSIQQTLPEEYEMSPRSPRNIQRDP